MKNIYITLQLFTSFLLANTQTVAISYFDNTSGLEEYNPLSKGLADMLITDLSNVKSIKIVEREKLETLLSEIKLGDSKFFDPSTAQKLGKGLGAGYMLTGSYFIMGETMRIDARLVNVGTGEVSMGEEITGEKNTFFELEKNLVEKLIETLKIPLPKSEGVKVRKIHTTSFESFNAYSTALDAYDKGKYQESQKYLEKAVEIDGDFEIAWDKMDTVSLSKEATLIEHVSSSELLIEATGKYISTEKSKKKARKDIEINGIDKAIEDAKRAAIYLILYGGVDPLIQSKDERRHLKQNESFYSMENISRYISWEGTAFQKKVKLKGGTGMKIVKRFKINKSILVNDLETHNIIKKRKDIADILGNPFIMVLPDVKKDTNPIEILQNNPKVKHAASVLESFLTARQYDVVVPQAQHNLDNLNSAQMLQSKREEDLAYQLALSVGSDIYITFAISADSASYGTEKYSTVVNAYETTTAKLLGSETGYSRARKGEIMVSIEEAMNGAIDNVLSRLTNYWESDLDKGVQYKLIISISPDFDEDEAETISFAFMDVIDAISNKSKENTVTSHTVDYILWCDIKKYNKSSKVYKYIKNNFNNIIEEEGITAKLRKINLNRKMILLKVDPE